MAHLDAVFLWLARTSAEASLIAVLILAVQRLLRRRLQARWHYCLWLILLVRLLMPWTPESRLSVFNAAPFLQTEGLAGGLHGAGLKPEGAAPAVWMPPTVSSSQGLNTAAPSLLIARRLPFIVGKITPLSLLWLLGALAFGAHIAVANLRFWVKIRKLPELDDARILGLFSRCRALMGLRTRIALVPANAVTSPAIFGLVKPRLLIPEGMTGAVDLDGLRYVFLHELAHVKRRDILINWLTTVLQALHWFNPVIWYAFHRMRGDREPACDALALSCIDSDESPEYGRTIVNLLEQVRQVRRVPGMAGILESPSQIKRRITLIARFTKGSYRWSPLALLLVIALGVPVLTRAKADTSPGNAQEQSPAKKTGLKIEFQGESVELEPLPDGTHRIWVSSGDKILRMQEFRKPFGIFPSDPPERVTVPVTEEATDKPAEPSRIEKALDAPVSLTFENTHLNQIVAFLSERVGLNVVVDNRVVQPEPGQTPSEQPAPRYVTDGIVSHIDVKDVPLREALKTLLTPLNLEFSVQPSFIWISTPLNIATESFEKLETRYYELRPDNAATVVDLLRKAVPDVFEPGVGTRVSRLEFNANTNQLVVHNTPTNLALFESLLTYISTAPDVQNVPSTAATTDLAIQDFHIEPYPEGGLQTAAVSIRNHGAIASPRFSVYFYVNDPGHTAPRKHNAGPIEAGGTWNEGSMPFGLREGSNTVEVVIDPEHVVSETDDGNNRASLQVFVENGKVVRQDNTGPAGATPAEMAPDLSIDEFKLSPYPEGGLYQAVVSIRNAGKVASPDFLVYFYLNDPDHKDPRNSGAGRIEPGGAFREGTMPFGLREGVNTIEVVLDPDNTVAETDENNNRSILEVTAKDGVAIMIKTR